MLWKVFGNHNENPAQALKSKNGTMNFKLGKPAPNPDEEKI